MENTPNPTPSIPPPSTQTPLATITKTAGFFSGKVLVTIITIGVLGGGLAAGYFLFPTVGKYLGLPQPTQTENAMDRGSASPISLFDEMPGADANVIMVFKSTPDFQKAIELANKKLAAKIEEEKQPLPEDRELPPLIRSMERATPFTDISNRLSQIQGIEKVILLGKFSPEQLTAQAFDFQKGDFAAALGIQVTTDKAQEFEKLIAETKEKPDVPVESKGNGIFIITNPKAKEPLTGKLSENKLLNAIKTSEANFALAMDVKASMDQWFEKNPQRPSKVIDPELELLKKARDVTIFGSLSQGEGETFTISLSAQVGMEDITAATELFAWGQNMLAQFTSFLPPDFQTLLSTDLKQEENFVRLEVVLKDVETMGKKVLEQFMAPVSLYQGLPSREVDKDFVPYDGGGFIGPQEESELAVPSGKIRRIKR